MNIQELQQKLVAKHIDYLCHTETAKFSIQGAKESRLSGEVADWCAEMSIAHYALKQARSNACYVKLANLRLAEMLKELA